ncbi:MAG: isochorismatase family protein, partial [Pyrinomonadaceae bacterium]|nr:isochorismatase family protein [Pyrinomonadaceae bacterium]
MSTEKALLVVDTQAGVVDWSQPTSAGSDEVLRHINELLAKARAAGATVIYIQHDGEEEGGR